MDMNLAGSLNAMEASGFTTGASTYWKPSLNTPFFLKPPTLVFNGLTAENVHNLATALAVSSQPIDIDIADAQEERIEWEHINYEVTCRELHSALQSTPGGTSSQATATLRLTTEEMQLSPTQLAKKLQQCLIRVQREANKLSPNEVRSGFSFRNLKTSLNSAVSLVANVIRKHMTAEFTEILKEDVQDISNTAVKLRVPNKRHRCTYHGLCTVRRQLDVGTRLAAVLHVRVATLLNEEESDMTLCSTAQLNCLTPATSSAAQSSSTQFSAAPEHHSTALPPTAETSSIAQESTAEHSHTQQSTSDRLVISLAFRDFIGKASSKESGDTITANHTVPSNTGVGSNQCHVHWKPSMNTPFFLKPPTIIFNGLTSENIQNLSNVLNRRDKQSTCGEKYCNIYTSSSNMKVKSSPRKSPVHKYLGSSEAIPKATLLTKTLSRDVILNDVIDVGVVKKRCFPTNKGKSKSDSQTLKTTKKSFNFKPPKCRPARTLKHSLSIAGRSNELDTAITAMQLSRMDISSCNPKSKLKCLKHALKNSTLTSTTHNHIPHKETSAVLLTPVPEYQGYASPKPQRRTLSVPVNEEETAKPEGTRSTKAKKTPRAILTAVRRLPTTVDLSANAVSPEDFYDKSEFICDGGLLIGAEVDVGVFEEEVDSEPEEVPRITLGKRSSHKEQLPAPLKQCRFD